MKSFKQVFVASFLCVGAAFTAAPSFARDFDKQDTDIPTLPADGQIDLGALLPLLYEQCGENAAICEQIAEILLGMSKGGTPPALSGLVPPRTSADPDLTALLPLLYEQCDENAELCKMVGDAILEYLKSGETPKLPSVTVSMVHKKDSSIDLGSLLPLLYEQCKEYESVCKMIGDVLLGNTAAPLK